MNPTYSCKSEMEYVRKQRNLHELATNKNSSYKNNIARLDTRENAFSAGYTNKQEGLTLAKL